MVDTARGTVIVPQVTPDESGWETAQSPPDQDRPGGASAEPFGASLTHFPIRGIPAPVGWVALGLILCVLFAYPMMLTAR